MLNVEHTIRTHFTGFPIETVIENVLPHPTLKDELLQLTSVLAMEPIIVDAADAGLIHRKRLWWTTINWEAVEERISDCTPWSLQWHSDRGWPRLHLTT